MQDTNWDDLRVFLAVTEAGSLSAAARRLGIDHSTVLRRLAGLEQSLGARLFDRARSGYQLTGEGQELRERLAGLPEQIASAHRVVGGRDLALSGSITVTSTDTLVPGVLTRHFVAFQQAHPGIALEVVMSNALFSLTRREADVAVRPSRTPPENLVGRCVGRVQTAVYAEKRLARRQAKTGGDLRDQPWVGFDDSLAHLPQAQWVARHVPAARVSLRVNSLVTLAEAVRAGAGFGLSLCHLSDPMREVRRVAGPDPAFDAPLWVLTHPDLRRVARIRAFTEFVARRLEEDAAVVPMPREAAGRRRARQG